MQPKILVIDDEEGIRFTFSVFLSEEGCQVETAATFEEAMMKIKSEEYDLIFADIVMDRDTGLDLLEESRKRWPNTPVIMITGVPSVETAAESLRIGALDYIVKPVRQETLLRVTAMALKHRAITEEKEKCRLNFEAVFRSVKDGIVTTNDKLQITDINVSATRLCGVHRVDVLLKPLAEIGKHCSGECINLIKVVLEKKSHLDDCLIECHSRTNPRQVVSFSGSPLLNAKNEGIGAVMVLRDQTRLQELERHLEKNLDIVDIVGQSENILKVKMLIRELADVRTTVLVSGESGTGKELVVDALHRLGKRPNAPLIKVNCAALSDDLLESELFGHVRGAFTGAVTDQIGRFERAHGGTIFLDEVGDISPRMQSRLLRVLESGQFERVGDSKTIQVSIRVVAATNQDLKSKVDKGEFRKDLFYRLKVVEIILPPLRDRRHDIPLLVRHFLVKFNERFSRNIRGISTETLNLLSQYHWPGNIRELENTIEHAFVRCRHVVITLDHLPPELQRIALGGGSSTGFNGETSEINRLRWALHETSGNKSRAAELLGLSRRTIYRKLEQFNIN